MRVDGFYFRYASAVLHHPNGYGYSFVLFSMKLSDFSLKSIYGASYATKDRPATPATVRIAYGGRWSMGRVTSHLATWSCKQPSPKSRWFFPSHSWTVQQKRSSLIRRPPQKSSAIHYARRLASSTSSVSRFISHCSIR